MDKDMLLLLAVVGVAGAAYWVTTARADSSAPSSPEWELRLPGSSDSPSLTAPDPDDADEEEPPRRRERLSLATGVLGGILTGISTATRPTEL